MATAEELSILTPLVAAAAAQIEEWQLRLRHAQLQAEKDECIERYAHLLSAHCINIYDPRLYSIHGSVSFDDLRALAPFPHQWAEMQRLFRQQCGFDLELVYRKAHVAAATAPKPHPLSAKDRHMYRQLQLALHPDKCTHPTTTRAYQELLIRVKDGAVAPTQLLTQLTALLPDVDAIVSHLFPTAAPQAGAPMPRQPQPSAPPPSIHDPPHPIQPSLSLAELVNDLQRWMAAQWYRWTRPEFQLPAYYMGRAAFAELDAWHMERHEKTRC